MAPTNKSIDICPQYIFDHSYTVYHFKRVNESVLLQPQIMALPINVGTTGKPGELAHQQPLQIQVVNPADGSTGEKYSLPLTLHHIQQGQVGIWQECGHRLLPHCCTPLSTRLKTYFSLIPA
jgi:hypothetical protein